MDSAPSAPSLLVAYVWLFAAGLIGGHRFYLGDRDSGTIYALTLGMCGLGVLADLYYLPAVHRKCAALHSVRYQTRKRRVVTGYT